MKIAFKKIGSRHFWTGVLITVFFVFIETTRIDYIYQVNQRVEGILYDFRLNLTSSLDVRESNENIVIVDIDEKSMREQGRYPWSRSKISELVAELSQQGAAVIAFDIFFSEPEVNPVDKIAIHSNITDPIVIEALKKVKHEVDADLEFRGALLDSESVLGFLLTEDTEITSGGRLKTSVEWDSNLHHQSLVTSYNGVISNIDELQEASLGLGFINSRADSDGFIRRAALVLEHKGNLYPSIALEAARLYTLSAKIKTNHKIDTNTGYSFFDSVEVAQQRVNTDEYGQMLIPFRGPAFSFPYLSATDVLNNRLDGEQLEGAVVFIGTSAVGLADLRSTSVGLQYPGVEIHANVFEGLMNPDIVPSEPDWTTAYLIIQMLLIGLVLSSLMIGRSAIKILSLGVGTVTIILGSNLYLWSILKLNLPLFLSVLLTLTLTFYYVFFGYVSESRTKKNIQSMFGQYVPPQHIERLVTNPKGSEVKSERREMSVLFADIRGFTTLSESLSPLELSEFLNEYLSAVTEVIFSHDGTIDKYVGDMVMAFWNAPIDEPAHAEKAIDSALGMQSILSVLNRSYLNKGWPEVALGIGISTGEMNVGDMGSQYRKAYTVLGDTVNLGSRIESLTKFYNVGVLVSKATKKQAPKYKYRLIDKVTVVGKNDAVEIYEPLSSDCAIEGIDELLNQHHEAFKLYYSKDWSKALWLFNQLIRNNILSTRVYEIMVERINSLDVNSLPENWSGEFIHLKK